MHLKLSTRASYHFLTWALLLLLLFLQVSTDPESKKSSIDIIIDIVGYFWILITTNYINLYIWKYYYRRKKLWIYAILSPLIFILSVLLLQLNNFLLSDYIPYTSIFKNGTNVFIFFLIAIGIDYLEEGAKDKKLIQELQVKTNEMELNALKAQLNPHFFFNTLNNIYGSIKTDPKSGAEMILSLSDVIRYHMQSALEARINVEQEWNIILEYIKIESLRLVSVKNLNVKSNITNYFARIPPLILFPLIENAFKHGTSSSDNWFIDINLEVSHKQIKLIIKNSVVNKKVITTNMGITNLRRRLSLIYGNKCQFITEKYSSTFLTQLEITL